MDEYDYQPAEAYGQPEPSYDLYTEEQVLRRKLDQFIEEYRKAGIEHARADRAYYVAKAARTLELRDLGMPVTLISQVIKGESGVAEKREEMLVAEVMTRAALEAILSTKVQIKLVDSALQREWANPQASY